MQPSFIYRIKSFTSSLLLMSLCVLVIIYQFKAAYVYKKLTGTHFDIHEANSGIFFIIYAVTGFLITPLIINYFLLKQKLSDFGLSYPAKRIPTLLHTLCALIILLPLIFIMARQPSIQAFYKPTDKSIIRFITVQLTILPIYYFAEEFFFRGFLFLNLWKRIGWHSYWITEYIFIVAHFGKPGLEILLSIPAGLTLSALALRTKSIYPCMFIHYSMGVLLNILVTYYFVPS